MVTFLQELIVTALSKNYLLRNLKIRYRDYRQPKMGCTVGQFIPVRIFTL